VRYTLQIPEERWFLKELAAMTHFLDAAASGFQTVLEAKRRCFQRVFGLQVRCGLDCYSLDFCLNYIPNVFAL
jgi:hypothetical protein